MSPAKSWSLDSRLFVGLFVIFLGIIFLLGNIFPEFDFWRFIGRLWSVVLIALGTYVILNRARVRRRVFLHSSTHSRIVGDMRIDLDGKEIGNIDASQMIGDLSIDLAGGRLRPGVNTLNVSSVIGDTFILVPGAFPLRVTGRALVGDINIDGRRQEGLFPKIDYADDGYEAASDKLLITIGGLIGDMTLQRV
jgi:predicted membrane protein